MSKPTGTRGMQETFRQAAPTYELVNHVLTLGLDIVWRKRAARFAVTGTAGFQPARYNAGWKPAVPVTARWLDICSGTGDMIVALNRLAPAGTRLFALDLTLPMLARAAAKPEAAGIGFTVGDVRQLPFPDQSFDLVTMSFAMRNVNLSREVLLHVFGEVRRVLRPGGRFVNVETSQPPNRAIRWLFHTFIKLLVRPIGQLISGSRGPYAYLSHTIPRFYKAEELEALLREGGFDEAEFTPMMLGSAAVHVAARGPQ